MRLRLFAALSLGLALAPACHAQGAPLPPNISAERAALGKLDFMLGTWKGTGWMMLGPGKKAEFTQTEIVERRLDGSLITVEGDGRDAANPERHIHSAFATLYFLAIPHEYHFTAFSAGNRVDVIPVIGDKTFQWGFDAPYGKTRFTLDYTTGQWHETGEFSRDGKTWTKNFEMTLTRS